MTVPTRWSIAAILALAGLVFAARMATIAIASPQRDPNPGSQRAHGPARPHEPAAATSGLTDELKAQLRALQDKLKAMREQFRGELDPLQAQIKTLRDKYEPQITQMQEQIKGIVEQGKSPEVQQLDREEDQELA